MCSFLLNYFINVSCLILLIKLKNFSYICDFIPAFNIYYVYFISASNKKNNLLLIKFIKTSAMKNLIIFYDVSFDNTDPIRPISAISQNFLPDCKERHGTLLLYCIVILFSYIFRKFNV